MNQSNQIKKTALYCRLSQDDGIEGDSNSDPKSKSYIAEVRGRSPFPQPLLLCG